MGTMIDRQGDRMLITKLAQAIPEVEHEINVKDRDDPAEIISTFKVNEDNLRKHRNRKQRRLNA